MQANQNPKQVALVLLGAVAISLALHTAIAKGDFITFSLAEVVGGGNGRGQQLLGNEGKDALSTFDGKFKTGFVWNAGAGSYPFSVVTDSPFVDGVATTIGTNVISSTGVSYDLIDGDRYIGYDYIRRSKHVEDRVLDLNGVVYTEGFGLNAGNLVTFDLNAFRDAAKKTAYDSTQFSDSAALPLGVRMGPEATRFSQVKRPYLAILCPP